MVVVAVVVLVLFIIIIVSSSINSIVSAECTDISSPCETASPEGEGRRRENYFPWRGDGM